MDKLTKADLQRRDDLTERLRSSAEALEQEHTDLTTAIETFNRKLDAHNEIINEASGWRDDLVSEIDEFVSNKSEKWQDGDKGQAVADWKNELEQLDLGEIEHVEVPDLPDLLHADTLEQMQTEAGG